METTQKKFKPVPRFNDHGSTCKGHANAMLDTTFEEPEERTLMVKILDRLIGKKDGN